MPWQIKGWRCLSWLDLSKTSGPGSNLQKEARSEVVVRLVDPKSISGKSGSPRAGKMSDSLLYPQDPIRNTSGIYGRLLVKFWFKDTMNPCAIPSIRPGTPTCTLGAQAKAAWLWWGRSKWRGLCPWKQSYQPNLGLHVHFFLKSPLWITLLPHLLAKRQVKPLKLSCATTGMDLESVRLREISQTNTIRFPLYVDSKKYNKQKQKQRTDRWLPERGWLGEWVKWVKGIKKRQELKLKHWYISRNSKQHLNKTTPY